MLRIVLAAHTLIIGLIGLAFVFYPALLAQDNEMLVIMTRSFGVSCLSMAILSSLLITMDGHKYVKQIGLVTLSAFHFGLTVVHLSGWLEAISPFAFPLIHAIFFVAFVFLTIRYYK